MTRATASPKVDRVVHRLDRDAEPDPVDDDCGQRWPSSAFASAIEAKGTPAEHSGAMMVFAHAFPRAMSRGSRRQAMAEGIPKMFEPAVGVSDNESDPRQACRTLNGPDRRKRSTMDHAATVRRLYDLLSAGDVDRFGELLADDFVEHEETPGLAPTKEGVKAFFRMYLAAFPDLRMEPEDVLVSGDKAVARVRATGTNQGEFMGIPATGRSVDVQLIDIFRFGDGLVREHWGVIDALAMMQQLGVVPEGPPA